jgi:hypothetical protein
MFFAEIIGGQLADSPNIKAEFGIGQIIVWNITISFLTLRIFNNQK